MARRTSAEDAARGPVEVEEISGAGQCKAEKSFPTEYVVGVSAALGSLHDKLALLSYGDFAILLLGETGVGKEYVARIVHAWSGRSRGPFVAINCAAIPAELFEAEMFGIAKGVATGVYERQGYFQQAEGGTLFLDEIGELEPSSQAKLLRVLQNGELRRVGGAPAKTDVRIIAATNADLQRRMREGLFRPDLYYRISAFEILVPPLRERKEDVPLFVEHYLKAFSREVNKSIGGITPEALRLLTEYHWPGNVRQLEQEVRRLVYLCPEGEPVDTALLSVNVLVPPVSALAEDQPYDDPAHGLRLAPNVARLERRLISQALNRSRGNHSQAAKLLGISRNGLAFKIQRLGIRSNEQCPHVSAGCKRPW